MAQKDLPAPDPDVEDIDGSEEIDEDIPEDGLVEEEVDEDLTTTLVEEEFEEDEVVAEEDPDYEEEDEGEEEDDEEDDDHDEETAEALEELENQELQLLDEEANEAMLVDEVAELRAMRREELTMNVDAQIQKSDEFVCQSCFMVKRTSQLANKRKMICFDCVD